MRSLVFIAALLLPTGGAAGAQPPQIDAQVSAAALGIDETVRLVVTIDRDASQTFQSYARPESKDFETLSQSEASLPQWTTVKGAQVVRSREQHVYVLKPKRKGTLTIPAAVARIDGRDLKTREIVVTVSAPARRAPGAQVAPLDPSSPSAPPAPAGMSGAEDVFVDVREETPRAAAATAAANVRGTALPAGSAPPDAAALSGPPAQQPGTPLTVRVGEQLIFTWTLYTRGDIWRYRTVAEPKHDDFWSEDLYAPPGRLAWQKQTVRGQDYEAAVLLKRALFPLKAGRLTVTPLEVEATTVQTAFYPGGSALRACRPVTVEVLPLPATGRPEGFETPNVGRFDILDSVDNVRPKAGDAITLRVVVKGQGNMRNLKLSKLEHIDGFKVYEPTALDSVERKEGGVEGTKALTYLLLPRKGGPLTVPAIQLPYFDPFDGRYAVAVAPAINITVEGDPEKIGAGGAEAKENVLGPRIRPLRVRRHVESAFGERLLHGEALLVALAAPPLVLLLIVGGGALRARLRRETAGSRRRRARAAARRHLRACEAHIKGGRPSAFFAEAARAIYEHLEYRLGMRCESYTVEELGRLLQERGFDDKLATATTGELEGCDFARFAASASGPGEMRAALRRVRQLLSTIERARIASRGAQRAAA